MQKQISWFIDFNMNVILYMNMVFEGHLTLKKKIYNILISIQWQWYVIRWKHENCIIKTFFVIIIGCLASTFTYSIPLFIFFIFYNSNNRIESIFTDAHILVKIGLISILIVWSKKQVHLMFINVSLCHSHPGQFELRY